MKKIILIALSFVSVYCMAHHYGPYRPAPHHHVHHYSAWGRGGSHFWPGFVGGVVAGAVIGSAVAPSTPVVVQQPVVVQPVSQPTVVQPTVVQPAVVVR